MPFCLYFFKNKIYLKSNSDYFKSVKLILNCASVKVKIEAVGMFKSWGRFCWKNKLVTIFIEKMKNTYKFSHYKLETLEKILSAEVKQEDTGIHNWDTSFKTS